MIDRRKGNCIVITFSCTLKYSLIGQAQKTKNSQTSYVQTPNAHSLGSVVCSVNQPKDAIVFVRVCWCLKTKNKNNKAVLGEVCILHAELVFR